MKIPKSKRARRVGVEIQKVTSEKVRSSVMLEYPGAVISIPEVRVSDDLKYARLYCSIFGTEDLKKIQISLKRLLPALRKEVAKQLNIRKIPELSFFWDDTMESADRIEQLLNNVDNSSSPTEEDESDDS